MTCNRPFIWIFWVLLGAVNPLSAQYYHKSVSDWEQQNAPTESPLHTIFLIGDAGAPQLEGEDPVLTLLRSQTKESGKSGTVVFLGDNIYPKGLPDTSANFEYQDARRRLVTQLDAIKDHPGKSFIIPGNHDWAQGGKFGWERALNQQDFVEEYLDEEAFLPLDGCPGPVEIELNEEVTLILINTQWWLHKWDKPQHESGCEIEDGASLLLSILDAIDRNSHKRVLIAGHHPLYTNGHHGGRFSLGEHIFPLREVNDALYIPLPVLGSIHPLYRGVLGNIQDVAHPRYQELRKGLMIALKSKPNVIYAAGHEHNLQYLTKDGVHLIVSGSGSKETYFGKGGKAKFGYAKKGFSRVDFYKDGSTWVSYWVTEAGNPKGKLAYRNKLYTDPYVEPKPPVYDVSGLNFQDSTVRTHPSDQYIAGKGKRRWWGNNYRDVWEKDVEIPVFDIGTEHGGLTIVQRGGGQQTKSLRLEAEGGKQYVLRSVEKYADGAMPEAFRGTIATALVQDQISTSNPYSAYAVPQLADAAGVYHANPQLVYIPNDPRFGEYLPDFVNTLALYEERPAGNRKDVSSFGNSKKIVNTDKVLKELRKDNDNRVDQNFVLRSRLFDTFIGDWDRHDDQWRWASFKEKNGTMFRPIPRDRDQAFFYADGIISSIYSRKWALRKFQAFKPTVRDMPGLGFNARFFDRSFLTEPDWADWKSMVDTLQGGLTDEKIETAIRTSWPKEIVELNGEYTINTLKARRDNLEDFARRLYLYLSHTVSVAGSKKHELIEVDRLPDGDTEVRMFKKSKKGKQEQLMYDRLFKKGETHEVRIYARGGDDEVIIRGDVTEAIKLRIIGGDGEDKITDQSSVVGAAKTTLVYDTKEGNKIELGTEGKDKTSRRENVNEYDRKDFRYNVTAPAIFMGFNQDDGVFLGGGTTITTHGFRKDPFATSQTIVANYAIKTGAVGMRYDGTYTDAFGQSDLGIDFDLSLPSYVRNFFGLGNETKRDFDQDEDFNFVNYRRVRLETSLISDVGNNSQFKIAPIFQYQRVVESRNDNRFIADTDNNSLGMENENLYENFYFLGGEASFVYDDRNDPVYPTRGLHFEVKAGHHFGLKSFSEDYSQVSGNLAVYFTLNPLATTVASRVGGAHNFGEFTFFNANYLDLLDNMRGYRRNRFAGRSAAYWNTELRTRLFHFKNYVTPMDVGILLVNDYGRVWVDNETSDVWHHGYGGGIWIKPYDVLVLSLVNAWSDEGNQIAFNMGFMF